MDQQSFANGWAWANDDYDANSQSWKSSNNERFTWKAPNYIPLGTASAAEKPLSTEERSQWKADIAKLNAEKAERRAQKSARKSERKRKKKLQQQQQQIILEER